MINNVVLRFLNEPAYRQAGLFTGIVGFPNGKAVLPTDQVDKD